MKIDKSISGIAVRNPINTAALYPLKEWDVITQIGDIPLDNQGMTKLNDNLLVSFRYWIQKIAKQNKIPITVVRRGERIALELPLSTTPSRLIPSLEGTYPPYFIYGPLIFSELTTNFISDFNKPNSSAPFAYTLTKHIDDEPSVEDERIVIVSSPFFPHKLTNGYSNPAGRIVSKINNVSIKNIVHLVKVLRDAKDEFITVDFDSKTAETLVLRRKEVLASTDKILADNGVRNQGTPALMTVWSAKSAH